jgi:hypothetical protein
MMLLGLYLISKEKLKSSSSSSDEDTKESKEPDYNEGEGSVRGKARRGNWRNNRSNNKPSFLK